MKQAYKLLLGIFIVFWALFIFFDYWQHHPIYSIVISNFQYWDLIGLLTAITGGLGFAIKYFTTKNGKVPWFNGLTLFALCTIVIILALAFFLGRSNVSPKSFGGSYLSLAGNVIYVATLGYFIMLVSHTIGAILNRLFFKFKIAHLGTSIVQIALGIMSISLFCFLVGTIGLLQWFIVFPFFAIFLAIGWKDALQFLKSTLVAPIPVDKNLNWIGIASGVFLLYFTTLNFLQIITPMPTGWDALTLYVNLPSLIHDYNGLVPGNQPYNWSLFMSLGFVLFDSVPMVLLLSMIGGWLTCLAMYQLGREWLKMSVNAALLSALLFYAMPTIGHQSYLELKVDLGLLFILMTTLIVFIDWLRKFLADEKATSVEVAEVNIKEEVVELAVAEAEEVVAKTKKKKKSKSKTKSAPLATKNISTTKKGSNLLPKDFTPNKSLIPHLILMGLLTGFGLGIKLTTVLTLFGVIAGMWYVSFGSLACFSICLISIFGVLLVRLDEMAGLRQYHTTANIVMLVCLVVGLGLFLWVVKKNIPKAIQTSKFSIIYIIFAVLPFVPWLVKNYADSGQLSLQYLLNGKTNEPIKNLKVFDTKYQQYKEQGN